MHCHIYFLYSESWNKFYVGISNNIENRLHRHNAGQSLSTKGRIPWKLLHAIECQDKSAAMLLETQIKKRGIRRYLLDHNILPGL